MLSKEASHRSKGFGFVYYKDKASVQKAIDHGPHLEINQIVAHPYNAGGTQNNSSSANNQSKKTDEGNNLFVTNIPNDWTEQKLLELFK